MVGDRRLDGHIHGMVQMDQLDRRAHADALGQTSGLADHQFGRGDGVDRVYEGDLAMVLADIGVAKAQLVGQHDLGDVGVIGLAGAGVRPESIGENAEFHGLTLQI